MNKTVINPWQWQDHLGYAQAIEIKPGKGTLYCSGQAAIDANGQPVAGTMNEQIELCLNNLEQVIYQSGYQPSEIVRLNFYTTSIPDFFGNYGTVIGWMKKHNFTPSSTLAQVTALAFPELQIEIEATVVS